MRRKRNLNLLFVNEGKVALSLYQFGFGYLLLFALKYFLVCSCDIHVFKIIIV